MRGWLFTKTHIAPRLIEKEDPIIKPGWVIVDIKAAGLCHSDVGALEDEGWMNIIEGAPLIFGHECAGVISEISEGVEGFKVGDRVGIAPIDPDTLKAIGYHYDGGYATKCMVPYKTLVHLPDEVSFIEGAAATDAGMTSHHALFVEGNAKSGMKVGIIGIGGLGQFAAGMALISGCEVYAVDVNEHARDYAKKIGCKEVYEDVIKLKDVKPELIIDFAGFGNTTYDAIESVAYDGTVVVIGMGKLEFKVNTSTLITHQIKIKGSNGGNADDIKGVYEFFKTGKLKPELHTISFNEIDKGLEQLKEGKVAGRLVALIDENE